MEMKISFVGVGGKNETNFEMKAFWNRSESQRFVKVQTVLESWSFFKGLKLIKK